MEAFLEGIFAVLIILGVLGVCFTMVYYGFKVLNKNDKPNSNKQDYLLYEEIQGLRERVETLERKVDNK